MDKNYFLLGQFYLFSSTRSADNLKIFLERSGFDLNYQIPQDALISKNEPSFIGYSALHFAVLEKRKDFIEVLLSHGADFTCKDSNGYTPLRLAIENFKNPELDMSSYQNILDLLLSAHVTSNNAKNPICNDGISHFHVSCLTDNMPVTKFFLEAGVSVNESVKETSDLFPGFSPLHFAVKYGNEDLVDLLLNHGADVNQVNGSGLTPLCLLVERNIEISNCAILEADSPDVTKIEAELLRNDALAKLFLDRCCYENLVNNMGLSFFHVSCAMKDETLAEKFLELGTDINRMVKLDSSVWSGYTPAHFAAHCNLKTFKLLLENGADILAIDAKGIKPLDLFIRRFKPPEVYDVLKSHPRLQHIQFWELFDAGNGMNPLHLAFHMRKKNVVDRILKEMASWDDRVKNCVDQEGLSYLHIACIADNVELVEKLLLRRNSRTSLSGCDPDASTLTDLTWYNRYHEYNLIKYRAGSTLYHIAAANGSHDMIEVISKAGAIMDLFDADGLTAVHIDFLLNHEWSSVSLKMLLSLSKINCSAESAGQLSHLHVACHIGDFESVKRLVSIASAADIDAPIDCEKANSSSYPYANKLAWYAGWTPLLFAVSSLNIEIINLLISKGANIRTKNANRIDVLYLSLLRRKDYNVIEQQCWELKMIEDEWRHDFNLTKLHIACILKDEDEIERLIVAGENVNARINANMRRWAGCTALHILMGSLHLTSGIRQKIKLLMKHGADLTLRNADNETPLLLLCQYYSILEGHINKQFIAEIIIEAGPRFHEVNPSNVYGLSHFHISCAFGNVDVVKKFMDSGSNINKSVSFLSLGVHKGFSPLHFAVRYSNREVVKLLLQQGTNWRLEDSYGQTPIIVAALEDPTILPIIFSNTEIDFQAEKNVFDESFFKLVFARSRGPEHINLVFRSLLDIGIRIKFVNFPARKRDIGTAAFKLDNDIFRGFVEKATDVTNIDAEGQNVIHSLGSIYCISPNYRFDNQTEHQVKKCFVKCALNVKLWLDRGCDLDLQDKLGRTPLYNAMITGGISINVLLLLGADVNLCYDQDRTSFSDMSGSHEETKKLIMHHMLYMSCSGLELNDSLTEIVRNEFDEECEATRNCNRDLAMMKNVTVTEDLSLRDLLSEKVVRNFPHFNVSKRNVILSYLRLENWLQNYTKWGIWINLFQLQYRKLLRRMKLFEPAKVSFYERIYRLDLLSIDVILQNLNNHDLENVTKV